MRFLRVKMSTFSFLPWSSNFLQKITKFGNIATSSRLRNLAQSLFVHKLLLNRILLVFYTSDQKLFWAILSSLMNDVIILFFKKRPMTDTHPNYSVQQSNVKALFIAKFTKTVLPRLLRGYEGKLKNSKRWSLPLFCSLVTIWKFLFRLLYIDIAPLPMISVHQSYFLNFNQHEHIFLLIKVEKTEPIGVNVSNRIKQLEIYILTTL